MATKAWKEKNKDRMRAYRRKWYKKNAVRAKAKVLERRNKLDSWFREIKSQLECSQCSEKHIGCLEFHHMDPTKKEMAVSLAVNNGWSKEKILEEISKCIVLCANCHRKLHWNKEPELPGQG